MLAFFHRWNIRVDEWQNGRQFFRYDEAGDAFKTEKKNTHT